MAEPDAIERQRERVFQLELKILDAIDIGSSVADINAMMTLANAEQRYLNYMLGIQEAPIDRHY